MSYDSDMARIEAAAPCLVCGAFDGDHDDGCTVGRDSCALCHTFTNHTTEQHEQAENERLLCVSCGAPKDCDDDEVNKCRACLDEYWQWREELYYDNLAKDEGGQG